MSVIVRCVIKVEEQRYAGDSVDMDIFEVSQWAGGSMSFASTPKSIIDSMVEVATDKAKTLAKDKLEAIKGNEL